VPAAQNAPPTIQSRLRRTFSFRNVTMCSSAQNARHTDLKRLAIICLVLQKLHESRPSSHQPGYCSHDESTAPPRNTQPLCLSSGQEDHRTLTHVHGTFSSITAPTTFEPLHCSRLVFLAIRDGMSLRRARSILAVLVVRMTCPQTQVALDIRLVTSRGKR
jgi:hypothetical protein